MFSTTHLHSGAIPADALNNRLAARVGRLRFSPALTALLSAVLVAGFSLAQPSPVSAQINGGERALLGKTQAVATAPVSGGSSYQSAAAEPRFPTGERALLGTSSQASHQLASKVGDVQPVFATRGSVDGEQALLGTRKRPKAVKQERLGEDS